MVGWHVTLIIITIIVISIINIAIITTITIITIIFIMTIRIFQSKFMLGVGASTWTQDILFNSFAPERDGTMMMFGVAGYSEETCILRLKTWFAHAFFHWIHADDTALREVFSKPARHFTDKPDSNIVDEMRDSKLWPAEQLERFL